ncbi:DUF3761 domain-containing protein [Snodgrassella sp.]|uniref:DUF3761 domain-containing protein n=1 Tax=Snodgrassella sp. TaxID=2815304 RepID=UPI00258F439F|nr:DUF3761 domain-containing protein [Snodgrassella sp.]MCO6525511.1 DUF3761 domain-containing protein [Snodgrassella sp.]
MKNSSKITMLFLCFCVPQFGFARITTDPNDPEVRSKCADGTYSTSVGRGTCSHHGGVVYDDLPRRKNKNEQPRNYPNSVRCTDGTSSKAGKGACSRHGGVAR